MVHFAWSETCKNMLLAEAAEELAKLLPNAELEAFGPSNAE